ncbi:hypothetical protein JCM5350_005408 [Sporobolomyces pararoseus]
MTSKKSQDLEQGETSTLLPSPPPYTALPGSSSSTSNAGPSSYATPLPPAPPPSSRPFNSHPQGPSPFSSLPLPQASLYAHDRQLSLRQADRRARRRFCAAMCWAMIIYFALAVISGAVVGAAIGAGVGDPARDGDDRGRHHRHRDDDWNGGWLFQRKLTVNTREVKDQVYATI